MSLPKLLLLAFAALIVIAGAGAAALTLRPELFSALVADGGVKTERGLAYGPHPRHRLDVYHPAANGNRRTVVFIHGGGWRSGERAIYRFAGAALASRGFTAVVPDYRLFPQATFPDWVEDAALVYDWARRNLPGCPPAIMGHSAGAHTAALLAYDRRYVDRLGAPQPSAFVGLAGPYSFDPVTWPTTKDIFAGANPANARPANFARGDAPPSLLIHGADDEDVRLYNLRDMEAALRAAGATVETRIPDGIGHIGLVLTLSQPFRWRAPTLEAAAAFVRRSAQCETPDAAKR